MSQPSSEGVLRVDELYEAVVAGVEDGRVSARRADRGGLRVEARNAVHGYRPRTGDRVLCTERDGAVYVTGVLVAAPAEVPAEHGVLACGEATARVEEGELVVRAADGTLLVSFDPSSGVTRVSAQQTVLSIEAAERLELKAPEVRVDAERLVQHVRHLVTEAEQIATSTARWDLRAGQITERARNVFRDVRDLVQTRAGTVRSIAREGMSLFAQRTSIRSKKDTAIDGERVLLG